MGNRAYFIALILLGGLSIFRVEMPAEFHIDDRKNPFFETFPAQIGEWKGKEVDVDERTYEILETRNVLSREYEKGAGDKVHLLLVSSNKDRRVAHPPEVCYLGSHFTITEEKQKSLPSEAGQKVPFKSFLAKSERKAGYQEYVLYVYKIGNQFTTSYYSQQLRFAFDQLSRQNSEILLIRIASIEQTTAETFLADVLKLLQK